MRILLVLCVMFACVQQSRALTFEKNGCQVNYSFTSSENPLGFTFSSRFANQSNTDILLYKQLDCDLSYIMFTTSTTAVGDTANLYIVPAFAQRDLNGLVIFKSPVSYPDGAIAGISASMQGAFVPEPALLSTLALFGLAFIRRH